MKVIDWLKKHKIILLACFITAIVSILLTSVSILFRGNFSVWYARFLIDKFYVDPVSDKDIKEGIVNGMVQSLDDDFSIYIPSSYGYDKYDSSVSGEFEGIGISISYVDGNSQVVEVYENSPAYKKGVLEGDIIIRSDDIDLKGKIPSEVSEVLRGKAGTTVNMTVLRDGKELTINDIRREAINTPSVKSKMIGDIGYIYVSNFDNDTDIELTEKLDILKDSQSLIIDLRDNPGGRLDVVLNSLDLFLDEGVVLIAKYKDNEEQIYNSSEGTAYEKPVVVLVNENSASAAEIFAAALKERDRAEIVGVNTYGKGSIQRSFILPDNSGINITVGRFYSPNGNKIDKVGVEPDVVIKLSDEYLYTEVAEVPFEDDLQLNKAIELLQ
ncbi:MAG: PDZ domain-containing protein [Clostridia bacterium]|nr:PDZ domain-containing protein [Clostridia bacterium]